MNSGDIEHKGVKTIPLNFQVVFLLICMIPTAACAIPTHRASTARPGSVIVKNAQSGECVEEPLVLVVRTSHSGKIEGVDHAKRYLDRAFIFDSREGFVIFSETSYGVLLWGKVIATQGFVVVAPGYQPTYFYPQARKRDERSSIEWPLEPLTTEQSLHSLALIRDGIEKNEIGYLIMETWGLEHAKDRWFGRAFWLNPTWPIEVRLGTEQKELVLNYLDRSMTGLQGSMSEETGLEEVHE